MSQANRTLAWALRATVVAGLSALSTAAFFGGCQSQPCGASNFSSDVPFPALECPSGDLCYRGDCIRACSAGTEQSLACTSDDECDSERPRCVDNFCSICKQGELCIPTLNICQAYDDLVLPEEPNKPMAGNRPPGPLDAGPLDGGAYLDGGLTRFIDAGAVEPPAEAEVTHVGYVDLGFEDDMRGGGPAPRRSLATVNAYDVQGNGLGLRWRADLSPPLIQCRDDDDDEDRCGARTTYQFGDCLIRSLRSVTASTAGSRVPVRASIGDIQIDSHPEFSTSIQPPIAAAFDGTQYILTPTEGSLAPDTFVPSALPLNQHYLTMTSRGEPMVTASAWPNSQSSFLGHHVPFLLQPNPTTMSQLSARTTVASPPTADLRYQWDRIDTGNDSFERVVVRMLGTNHELYCSAIEGQSGYDTIVIPSVTLSEWRSREPAGVYTVYFERASIQRLPINPAAEGLLLDVTIRVRHSLISEVEFQ